MFCIILSISGTSMYPAMVARHVVKTQKEIINGAQVWRNLGNYVGGMIKIHCEKIEYNGICQMHRYRAIISFKCCQMTMLFSTLTLRKRKLNPEQILLTNEHYLHDSRLKPPEYQV